MLGASFQIKYLLLFLGGMSLIAFLLYAIDKDKARRHAWRIPEKTLLGFGILGGAAGAVLAMLLFRHKTRRRMFWSINLLALALHAAILCFLYSGG